ncbi:MAG: flagellar basal body rod protein FlgC [Candidatus Lindowbacteria bacterium RIFCSPLOWO2_12_FULL_62_27]|nr:MAG: flagellar basal body rod protein FlgC [Candidatus Lindowbacteria bacterium RIFCSPLOWO2_02_FULL_62_12]OGH63150.1 MAG: flagellar basal body rod protein FlgC [Candidatus Lindowbacteria bacterium RIFCSPLOWO2_12_FULL_62_27]
MSLFSSINASSTGLTAQRTRMDVIANNIANVDTPNYKRQLVIFRPKGEEGFIFNIPLPKASIGIGNTIGEGVIIDRIKDDLKTPKRLAYMPGHPDADEKGYVHLPNVNVVTEMVDLIDASRAYEANVSAIRAAKGMHSKALDLLR